MKYYKIGTKYYVVENGKLDIRYDENNPNFNSLPTSVSPSEIENNSNAKDYYEQALALKNAIKNDYGGALARLTTKDAVDEAGRHIEEEGCNIPWTNEDRLFDELYVTSLDDIQIEDKNSTFYSHKMDVIKYCIEKNLSVAISNFNDTAGSPGTNFEMPKLKASDWDEIAENISMISFLQGLGIGGKMYNGYSIAVNNKNEEFVSEDAIYIETTDADGNNPTYHDVRDLDLINDSNLNVVGAYFNTNYEKKSVVYNEEEALSADFYPREALGCYHSIVLQSGVSNYSIKDWLLGDHDLTNKAKYQALAKIYYTALGRERDGMYRVENAY